MIDQVFKTLYQSGSHTENIWIVCPFAGGSQSAFKSWTKLDSETLPENSLVMLATYPGRDQRMRERPLSTISDLADDIFDAFVRWENQTQLPPNANICLCGHSMGAQVAFEVCTQLEEYYGSETPVKQIILSGCHAPHLESRRKLSHLSDNDFIDQLIEIGSGSPVLKQNPELLPIFLPMLRADFIATETYVKKLDSALELNFTQCSLVFGECDPEAWESEVKEWERWICPSIKASTQFFGVPGDHFYLTTTPAVFIRTVVQHSLNNIFVSPNTKIPAL